MTRQNHPPVPPPTITTTGPQPVGGLVTLSIGGVVVASHDSQPGEAPEAVSAAILADFQARGGLAQVKPESRADPVVATSEAAPGITFGGEPMPIAAAEFTHEVKL